MINFSGNLAFKLNLDFTKDIFCDFSKDSFIDFMNFANFMANTVSIIITTKNEERNIADCIKSILRQSYPCDKIEIIIVDNFSTDKTKRIALSFFSSDKERLGRVKNQNASYLSPNKKWLGVVKNPSINFYTKGPERSAQRNYGVKMSKGDFILYLDADMILGKDVIRECMIDLEIGK